MNGLGANYNCKKNLQDSLHLKQSLIEWHLYNQPAAIAAAEK